MGAAIAIGTFALAKAQIFAPSAPAGTAVAGDATRGQSIFHSTCAGCHGAGGKGGGVGPALAGTGLDAATVMTTVQQGRSVMPAGLVSGQDLADVVAYVVSISSPSG